MPDQNEDTPEQPRVLELGWREVTDMLNGVMHENEKRLKYTFLLPLDGVLYQIPVDPNDEFVARCRKYFNKQGAFRVI